MYKQISNNMGIVLRDSFTRTKFIRTSSQNIDELINEWIYTQEQSAVPFEIVDIKYICCALQFLTVDSALIVYKVYYN